MGEMEESRPDGRKGRKVTSSLQARSLSGRDWGSRCYPGSEVIAESVGANKGRTVSSVKH